MSAETRVRITAEHNPGCLGGDGDLFQAGPAVYRDAIGRRNQGALWRWERFVCNDPSCPFEALIRWDRVSEAVTVAVRAARPGGQR